MAKKNVASPAKGELENPNRFLRFPRLRNLLSCKKIPLFSIFALAFLLVGSAAATLTLPGIPVMQIFSLRGNTTTNSGNGSTAPRKVPPLPTPTPILLLPGAKPAALAIGTNLDQLHNGVGNNAATWANGNINSSNSCYSEGDVVPYRYFVTGIADTNTHMFTIQYEFTKAGKHAFDYLTDFNATEAGPLGTIGGGCGTGTAPPADCMTPVVVASFPNPTSFLTPLGYSGGAFSGSLNLYAYNAQNVTFDTSLGTNGYLLSGSAASASDVSLKISFKAIDPTKSVGFFWGGHLAQGTTSTWGVGNGAGSISGAPFHVRAINFDGGGGANQDRSIQNGAVCLPPSSNFTPDVGPYCPGSTHTATATVANDGNTKFEWMVTGATVNGPTNTNTISFTASTTCNSKVDIKLTTSPTAGGGCPGDSCSESTTKSVDVKDEIKPVISCPANVMVECGTSTDPSSTGTATATDNCDQSVTITYSDQTTPSNTCNADKIKSNIARTWKAVDACGNEQTCVQTITTKDTTAPTISKGTIDACYATPDAAEKAALAATTSSDSCGSYSLSAATTGTCAATVTVTSTDSCGNASSVSYNTKVDGTPPTVTAGNLDSCFKDQAAAEAAALTATTATDNCGTPTKSVATTLNGCSATIKVTGTDSCGLSAFVQYTAKIDATAPDLTIPADKMLECGTATDPSNTGAATALDNCDGAITPGFTDVALPANCTGQAGIERTWTATDSCGNTVSKKQTITFVDTTKPVLSGMPADASYQCLSDVPGAPSVTATDNCAGTLPVTLSTTESNPGSSCNNNITRTWTATDACGNKAEYTQKITVNDTTAPVLSANPASLTIQCLADVPAVPAITASDNCNGTVPVAFNQSESNPGSSCNNVITRLWTAKDVCNNTVSWAQKITVNDTTPPAITAFPTAGVEACVGAIVTIPALTALDNCNGAVPVVYTRSDGRLLTDLYPVGVTTVSASATDVCGNKSAIRQYTVTIKDCPQAFCSLTQGGWGNSNGKFNGEVRTDTLNRLITLLSPLQIGWNGGAWMMTFNDGAEGCVIQRMPAGGTAAKLPVGLNLNLTAACDFSSPLATSLLKNGRFNNVLIGQTITLALNVRLDNKLGGSTVCHTMITAKALPGPDGKVGTSDDLIEAPGADLNLDGVPDNYLKVTIPDNVFKELDKLGLPYTVNNILKLANDMLGSYTATYASLSDINGAADAINHGFDECRFRVSCTN